jgi:hypothetical protein
MSGGPRRPSRGAGARPWQREDAIPGRVPPTRRSVVGPEVAVSRADVIELHLDLDHQQQTGRRMEGDDIDEAAPASVSHGDSRGQAVEIGRSGTRARSIAETIDWESEHAAASRRWDHRRTCRARRTADAISSNSSRVSRAPDVMAGMMTSGHSPAIIWSGADRSQRSTQGRPRSSPSGSRRVRVPCHAGSRCV